MAQDIRWNTGYSYAPEIAIDSLGDLHAVWVDGTPGIWGGGEAGGDDEIMYAKFINSTSQWSNATVISDGYAGVWGWNTDWCNSPNVITDESNNAHVVWTDLTDGAWGTDSEVMYTKVGILAGTGGGGGIVSNGGGGGGGDDGKGAIIPFGNFYLIFTAMAIFGLIIYRKFKN